ncbi:MAG: hypothetical protein LCH63_13720 [Candidatus Melainabacteria bacterium]|nr:hypothetical protein [Candidatus Melainabacteria bacterium]
MTSIRQCLEPFLSTDAGGRIVVEGFDHTCLYFINRADAERRALGYRQIEELLLLRFLLLDAPLPLASIIEGAAIEGVDFDREISLALEQVKEREADEVSQLVPQENQNSLVWYFTESLAECLLGARGLGAGKAHCGHLLLALISSSSLATINVIDRILNRGELSARLFSRYCQGAAMEPSRLYVRELSCLDPQAYDFHPTPALSERLSPASQACLTYAGRIAMQNGHRQVSFEHIIVALLKDPSIAILATSASPIFSLSYRAYGDVEFDQEAIAVIEAIEAGRDCIEPPDILSALCLDRFSQYFRALPSFLRFKSLEHLKLYASRLTDELIDWGLELGAADFHNPKFPRCHFLLTLLSEQSLTLLKEAFDLRQAEEEVGDIDDFLLVAILRHGKQEARLSILLDALGLGKDSSDLIAALRKQRRCHSLSTEEAVAGQVLAIADAPIGWFELIFRAYLAALTSGAYFASPEHLLYAILSRPGIVTETVLSRRGLDLAAVAFVVALERYIRLPAPYSLWPRRWWQYKHYSELFDRGLSSCFEIAPGSTSGFGNDSLFFTLQRNYEYLADDLRRASSLPQASVERVLASFPNPDLAEELPGTIGGPSRALCRNIDRALAFVKDDKILDPRFLFWALLSDTVPGQVAERCAKIGVNNWVLSHQLLNCLINY